MNISPSLQRKDPTDTNDNDDVDSTSVHSNNNEEGGVGSPKSSPIPISADEQPADLQDVYALGDVVECQTDVGETSVGEVLSYDKVSCSYDWPKK